MIPAIIETERVLPILRKYVNYAKSFIVQNLRRQIENISEIIKVTLTCVFDDFNSNVIVQKYISSIESELSELFSYNDMETYFLDSGKEEELFSEDDIEEIEIIANTILNYINTCLSFGSSKNVNMSIIAATANFNQPISKDKCIMDDAVDICHDTIKTMLQTIVHNQYNNYPLINTMHVYLQDENDENEYIHQGALFSTVVIRHEFDKLKFYDTENDELNDPYTIFNLNRITTSEIKEWFASSINE